MDLDKRLDRRADVPHWIRTFDGGHVWPPTPVCAEALNWIELVAAKRAGLTPDATLAEALVAKTAARAAALEAAGDVFRAVFELGAASSALAGIADTGELVGTAARLRLTDAFKHAEKKEAERSRKEEALMTGLYRTLSVLEKTVLMRRDLGEFLSEVDGLAKELKKAQDASDRDFTRRLLLTISVDSGDRGGAFLASKTPEKAVPCFEIAVRASIHDPARYKTNLYNLACAYARSGNVRFALDSLRRAVENGFSDRAVILRDTDLDAIKDRPEFQEILANIR
jgi:tetratricopeptide (TPR) repeat protein